MKSLFFLVATACVTAPENNQNGWCFGGIQSMLWGNQRNDERMARPAVDNGGDAAAVNAELMVDAGVDIVFIQTVGLADSLAAGGTPSCDCDCFDGLSNVLDCFQGIANLGGGDF